MRTEQLLYFHDAAQLGSINAAAEKLHISQQGLNAALKMLEKDLGYELFTTSRYGITLTPQGEIVLTYANKILTQLDAMQNALKESIQKPSLKETISIEIAPVVSEFLFPYIFNAISNTYPNIALSLTATAPLPIIHSIKDGVGDLGILGIQYTLLDKLQLTSLLSSELHFFPLYQYKLSLLVSENHPLANYKSLSTKTLLKYPIALQCFSNLEDDLNYQWLKLYGTPHIKLSTSSSKIYYDAIQNGSVIGFFPATRHGHFNIAPPTGTKTVTIKDENAIHTVGYLYNSTKPVTPAMQIVMDELRSFCH